MTEEQKSQLNELLDSLKNADNNSIKCFNEGTLSGVESVQYDKGDDYLEYHRDFECYSYTVNIEATNDELIEHINHALENDDYSSFVEPLGESTEFLNTDKKFFNTLILFENLYWSIIFSFKIWFKCKLYFEK